jgi:flavin reductase (DIM6/NTAB) family NADH-FMN oxidoreductase RutF
VTTPDPNQELQRLFRLAFRRFPAPVTVLSYADTVGHPSGMTATAVTSLSVDPPAVLVSLNRAAKSRGAIVRAGRFGVNMLALGQEAIATHCSRSGTEKILAPTWLLTPTAAHTPVLRDALAHLDCTITQVHDAYTHSLVVAEVVSVWLGRAARPLLYSEGAYRTLDAGIEESYEMLWERTFL